MAQETVNVVKGLSFTQVLTIAFIVLKLTNVITWSWWWVLSPLWIPAAIILGAGVIIFIVSIILAIIGLK
jgi:hypothetical protein